AHSSTKRLLNQSYHRCRLLRDGRRCFLMSRFLPSSTLFPYTTLFRSPVRARIIEAGFYFTRQLAAGQLIGLESYRVDKVQYDRTAKPSDYAISDRVLEAFRNYVRKVASTHLQVTQIDAKLDCCSPRLRERLITSPRAPR